MTFQKIGIIGAGAWGTALSLAFMRSGREVLLWAREAEVAASINNFHENTMFLPGVALDASIRATTDVEDILKQDALFIVVPSQFARATLRSLRENGLPATTPIILCCKGVERQSLQLMTEVAHEELPANPIGVLSGPTFAIEVARGLPASVTLACKKVLLSRKLKKSIQSDNFKVFLSKDLIGAEIGGAVKNVIAIACGIAEGHGLGQNAKAALIVRGLTEMRRICRKKGGRRRTLMQLCGIGDLILTANSQTSRNFSLGYALGQGKTLEAIMADRVSIAEGVDSAQSVVELAKKLNVEVPICDAVYRIVHGHEDIHTTIGKLVRES